MILEGLVTTIDKSGQLHLAPMGPDVEPGFRRFELRPFPSSQTYQNLCESGEGVLHVTDDVLLLARAAIGRIETTPPHRTAEKVRGFVLSGACRAYEFEVRDIDRSQERVRMSCEVVHSVVLRDFFGFNRAKHAVVEAAILATRIHLLPIEQIRTEFERLHVLVRKTGGPPEHEAFDILKDYVESASKEKA